MSMLLRGLARRPLISSCVCSVVCILMSVTLDSCSPVLKWIYGVKSPEPVHRADVVRFRSQVFKDTTAMVFLRSHAPQELSEWSVPEAFLFDSHGKPIDFRNPSKPECNGPLEGFLENLRPKQQHPSGNLEHMDLLLREFSSKPCSYEAVRLPAADYHLMVTFATWTGQHIYRQTVLSWIKAAQANASVKIHITLLNVDGIFCEGDSSSKL